MKLSQKLTAEFIDTFCLVFEGFEARSLAIIGWRAKVICRMSFEKAK